MITQKKIRAKLTSLPVRAGTGVLALSCVLIVLIDKPVYGQTTYQKVNFTLTSPHPIITGSTTAFGLNGTDQAKKHTDSRESQIVQSTQDPATEPTQQLPNPLAVTEEAGTSAEGMPESLTTPVLPNVPSSLSGDGTTTQQGTSQTPNATDQPKKETVTPASSEVADESTNSAGPEMRNSFSVLFTDQRPFLLYSQDTSITYLMPSALVNDPDLGRYLRRILEDRALLHWQEARVERAKSGDDADQSRGPRPSMVVSGRVEDRFASELYSSLYLEEIKGKQGQAVPNQVLSFNYNHKSKSAFGLSELFKSKNDKPLVGTIELIAAYVRADIVRQKTIRLGTKIAPDQDAWLKDLKPSLELFQTFTLVPARQTGKVAGLAFHFNPGVLGAEADGSYTVYVPASIFAPALSETFKDRFGGEALTISRHNAQGFSTASVNVDGLKPQSELGGDMLLEGEVPGDWCDGFHLTLSDVNSGQIVSEGMVQMLPDLPAYGLSANMIRFRAEISVSGDGGNEGKLVFEPYKLNINKGRLIPRDGSACDESQSIALPDPNRDAITVSVTY